MSLNGLAPVPWYHRAMPLLPGFDDDRPAQASRLAPRLRALAAGGLYLGTRSWKYEGWLGSVYTPGRYETRGRFSKSKFEGECLAEYAEVFPTVCGDFAFYQFPSEDYWARLFGATPADSLFGFKVPEDVTVATWPTHARYGARAGERNGHFLDARTFVWFFARRLGPYKGRVAALVFEFGTFNKGTFPTPGDFLGRLGPFLASLTPGFRYAVEIRNPEYLSPDYFDLLARHNAAHVFNSWTRMLPLDEQARLPGAFTADFTVVRALLRRGRLYEQAVQTFEPYREIQEPNEGAREGMVRIARRAREREVPAYVFVNNRLEGHAPSTIEAVADAIGGGASPRSG
jgi:uncharacterized protein YecE (DUF72 family)